MQVVRVFILMMKKRLKKKMRGKEIHLRYMHHIHGQSEWEKDKQLHITKNMV